MPVLYKVNIPIVKPNAFALFWTILFEINTAVYKLVKFGVPVLQSLTNEENDANDSLIFT